MLKASVGFSVRRSQRATAMLIALIACWGSLVAQTVTGSGTIKTVPMFTGTSSPSSSIGDSPLAISNGNVGIGTSSPQKPLEIDSTIEPALRLNNTSYTDWDIFSGGGGSSTYNNMLTFYNRTGGQWVGIQNNGSLIVNYGSVGIGTTSPQAALHVVGSIRKDFASTGTGGTAYWMLYGNDGNGNINEYFNSTGTAAPTAVVQGAGFRRMFSPGSVGGTNLFYYQYANPVAASAPQAWLDYMTVDATNNYLNLMDHGGNVGVGTSSPVTTLHVVGQIGVGDATPEPGYQGRLVLERPASTGQQINFIHSGQYVASLGYLPNSTTFGFGGGTTSDLSFTPSWLAISNGKVGLGTTSPAYKLDVSGGQVNSSGGYCIAGVCITSWPTTTANTWSGAQTFGGSTNFPSGVWNANGNVGIGTGTAAHRLTVSGDIYADKSSIINSQYLFTSVGFSTANPFPSQGANADWSGVLLNQPFANGDSHHLAFSVNTDNQNSPTYVKATIDAWRDGSGIKPDLEFDTDGNARMTISSAGKVGIGTTTPTYTLDVAGQIHASGGIVFPDGSIQTVAYTGCTGGDYAESMDVTGDPQNYTPGDVLVLDPDNPGRILKSSGPYAATVAGIYSTKPGFVGRRQTTLKSDSEVPMAMVGVVPTKVSAENGPIKVGDLLVSSTLPGYAMKGTDRTRMLGAVVGKAMGSLDSGTGTIEVLVSLQ